MRTVVIYGSGGHGKVIADILLSIGDMDVLGFLDDEGPADSGAFGLPTFDAAEWLAATHPRGVAVALGIGDNGARSSAGGRCSKAGFDVLTAVHPSSFVSRSARLGAGTVVMANAVINSFALIGTGAIINTGAIVEHDSEVGDYAHISPGAMMGGAARIGSRAHLGLGSVVLPGISVGSWSVVGAGAVVVKDLPDGVVAVGVPARVTRTREASR